MGRSLSAAVVVGFLFAITMVALLAISQGSASATFDGLPTETPRRDLPRILDGVVLDTAQVGNFIVVVGDFTQVERSDGRVFAATGAYAYDINTGSLIESFLPSFTRNNGNPTIVRTVTAAGPNSVFIGGRFNSVNGTTRHRLVKISITTGTVDPTFVANTDAEVNALVTDGNRLFVGGDFNSINSVPRSRLAEVNATTGAVNLGFRLDITQSSRDNPTFTYGPRYLGITDDGVLVVVHRAERVGGFLRPGIALIDVQTNSLLGYSTDFWNGEEILAFDADLSPDGSYIVVVSNGGDEPLLGRDAGVRFDITDRSTPNQGERWIARNFDSTYSVAISNSAVFMGGHFCNVEGPNSPVPFPGIGQYTNDNSCFGITPASRFPTTVNRDQLAAFDPATGTALDWDPGSDGFVGVTSLEVTSRGLLVGHDGTFLGRDGNQRRAWNVGRHGFFDIANPTGRTNLSINPPTCSGREATIIGTAGPDTISGTAGVDVIVGFGGQDNIGGLAGNDFICGGPGNDVINGGAGNDTILGEAGGDLIAGGNGNDIITGGNGADTISGGNGNDLLNGSGGNDNLTGNEGDDRIFGGSGGDKLAGGAGGDDLRGGKGADTITGGGGNDALAGHDGSDDLRGGDGVDRLVGGTGNDLLIGAAGADTLNGGNGTDRLNGGPSNDSLRGGNGHDALFGGSGLDSLQGENGDDSVDGGIGVDRCAGSTFATPDGLGDVRLRCEN